MLRILQRLEDRAFQPALKVNGALKIVVEGQMNSKATLVLGPNNGRQELHTLDLTQALIGTP
jgi:hypothetical protein